MIHSDLMESPLAQRDSPASSLTPESLPRDCGSFDLILGPASNHLSSSSHYILV